MECKPVCKNLTRFSFISFTQLFPFCSNHSILPGNELPAPWFQYKTAFRFLIGALLARQINYSFIGQASSIQLYFLRVYTYVLYSWIGQDPAQSLRIG